MNTDAGLLACLSVANSGIPRVFAIRRNFDVKIQINIGQHREFENNQNFLARASSIAAIAMLFNQSVMTAVTHTCFLSKVVAVADVTSRTRKYRPSLPHQHLRITGRARGELKHPRQVFTVSQSFIFYVKLDIQKHFCAVRIDIDGFCS
ncbi:hypothetical protein PILCRDRAFT_257289 [Piloderma croceum F 1598]|uniref:Uncharacterized protein n=1 Tax=Piloderma croceum (strain F 1598) TaxID=765440 RepID=A0A0C3BPM5_PILCF|nr:hypothetical protein PILCRDRAFT_257289 [Piloderma croceum F 1598]